MLPYAPSRYQLQKRILDHADTANSLMAVMLALVLLLLFDAVHEELEVFLLLVAVGLGGMSVWYRHLIVVNFQLYQKLYLDDDPDNDPDDLL